MLALPLLEFTAADKEKLRRTARDTFTTDHDLALKSLH
jgi:hypothetical protein